MIESLFLRRINKVLDIIQHVETFSNIFMWFCMNCNTIYEKLKNSHEGETIVLHISAILVKNTQWFLHFILMLNTSMHSAVTRFNDF